MKPYSKLKILGAALLVAATGSLGLAQADPSPAPPPRPPGAPPSAPRPPGKPGGPEIKYSVRITKAPALEIYSSDSVKSRVVATLPQGTTLDVHAEKGRWLHVSPKGAPRPVGWASKDHTIKVR